MHPTQLVAAESALLVIDVQEKLVPLIHGGADMVRNVAFLLDGARLLDIPTIATEQYPKGLGGTVAPLIEKLPRRPDKVAFSSCAASGVLEFLQQEKRTRVVLAGIESHVCVLNTALDLLAGDYWVYIAVDALGSRYRIDHETALRRLEGAGAILTTVETVIFEWTASAAHPKFKQISALVQERAKGMIR